MDCITYLLRDDVDGLRRRAVIKHVAEALLSTAATASIDGYTDVSLNGKDCVSIATLRAVSSAKKLTSGRQAKSDPFMAVPIDPRDEEQRNAFVDAIPDSIHGEIKMVTGEQAFVSDDCGSSLVISLNPDSEAEIRRTLRALFDEDFDDVFTLAGNPDVTLRRKILRFLARR